MMLNVGPTRADGLDGIEKIEWKSGDVLREVCTMLLCVSSSFFLVVTTFLLLSLCNAFLSEGRKSSVTLSCIDYLRAESFNPP